MTIVRVVHVTPNPRFVVALRPYGHDNKEQKSQQSTTAPPSVAQPPRRAMSNEAVVDQLKLRSSHTKFKA